MISNMNPYKYPWNYVSRFGDTLVKNLKDRSSITLRLWTYHCEYIMAQRFRRGIQITNFYHRFVGDNAFKNLLSGFRRQMQRHIKSLLLSSVGVYVFDWDSERIKLESVKNCFEEIDFIEQLKQETLLCRNCNKRKAIGEKYAGIDYCNCPQCQIFSKSATGWEPYIERKNMIIWRREEKSSLFAYKVYVKYKDITAEDFLHVQTDIEYRKQWDDTAISLEIIDSDPTDDSTSHVIYWEMKWPRLFANRDYVYNRKHFVDKSKNMVVICNKSTNHPKCPVKPEKQRVEDYWSYMVIRPFKSFKNPGLEFVLTYFDDPGLAIPSAITSWVAQKQMPEFLNKLYLATKMYAEKKKQKNADVFSSWENFKYNSEHLKSEAETQRRVSSNKTTDKEEIGIKTDSDDVVDNTDVEPKQSSWWSYLHPYSYFA